MSINSNIHNFYDDLKVKLQSQLQEVSMDVESLLKIDIAKLPITKLVFQFVVAVIAVFATFAELAMYLGKNTFKTLFSPL